MLVLLCGDRGGGGYGGGGGLALRGFAWLCAGERSGRAEGLLTRAGVGWFLCDSGGGGHAAATTSANATVAGPELLSTLVLVVARPPPPERLRTHPRHRPRGASWPSLAVSFWLFEAPHCAGHMA